MKRLLLALPALLLAAGCGAAPAARTAPAPAPEAPALGCWNGGAVLYRETTRNLERGTVETLVIHETGAWHLEAGHRSRRGCLAPDQVETIEQQLTSVRRAPPDTTTCSDAPTRTTLVEVPGVGAISYRWPCARGPDDATRIGIETARDLTWRAPRS